jgi:hypothetical protein
MGVPSEYGKFTNKEKNRVSIKKMDKYFLRDIVVPVTTPEYDYLLDNEWVLIIPAMIWYMGTTNYFNTRIKPLFDEALDVGLKVWADVESCFRYRIGDTSYETALAAGFDGLESLDIEGYMWESGVQAEVEWLHDRTRKKLHQWWPPNWFNDTSSSAWPPCAGMILEESVVSGMVCVTPLADRLALVDQIAYEFYFLSSIPEAVSVTQYMHTNYPSIPAGICTTRGDMEDFTWNPWGLNGPDELPESTTAERWARMTQGMVTLKNELWPFDFIMDIEAMPSVPPLINEYCQFVDNLHLDTPFSQVGSAWDDYTTELDGSAWDDTTTELEGLFNVRLGG